MTIKRAFLPALIGVIAVAAWTHAETGSSMEPIVLSEDGSEFRYAESGERFTPWGFNYDRDTEGRLLESYWDEEWDRVVQHFQDMRDLGANTVRIHLQTGAFMDGPETPNEENLARLVKLVEMAEETGLYLNITGLACYHKDEVPEWYDAMDEAERWETQAAWWRTVAEAVAGSPAVFCYNLMNEPILTGGDDPNDWLPGDGLSGKHFVQRITLDLDGRERHEVARAWVDTLTGAIREVDEDTLVTVGVIPWAHVWPNAQPLFYSEEVRENLDFASVHFYPRSGEVEAALEALAVYDVGMPLVIEETFPLHCGIDDLAAFFEGSRDVADGWIGFYWGMTIEDYEERGTTLAEAITRSWLEYFRDAGPAMLGQDEPE